MSYIRKRYGNGVAMSGIVDDIIGVVKSTEGAVGTAVNVATDPYLPEVACRVGQLQAIRSGKGPGPCSNTPDNLPGGIGLSAAVKPLRAYVYAQQHKWVYPVAIAAILGLPLLIGYEIGKGGKSS